MTRSERLPVLLLGGYRQAPAVARSLARAGYRVIVGVGPHGNPAARSRFAGELWHHTDVGDVDFIDGLRDFAASHDRLAVFPLGDSELLALSQPDSELPPELLPIMPASETVRTCLDKSAAQDFMTSVGVSPPETRTVRSLEELGAALAGVGVPAVIKPDTSLATIAGNKALICSTVEEARTAMPEWPAGASYLLVQEYVRGRRHNCHLVAESGSITARFEQVIVRTDRLDGTGLCVEARSGVPTEELWELCRRITEGAGYTGAACIQFLMGEEGQGIRCLEVNPRMCASCAFPVHCGVDMPLATLEAALRARGWVVDRAGSTSGYRRGETMNWLLGDITGVIEQRGAMSGRDRIRAVSRVFGSAARADVHVTWSWTDPVPTLVMFRGLLRRVGSAVLGRFRR
ncbi:MAG: ATP-grasp domain-containing protein [Gemmatimonadota bacterium]